MFKVIDYPGKIDNGWRLATVSDVQNSMELVKNVLRNKYRWIICKLEDGSVKGSGYRYKISTTYNQEWEDQLIIKLSKLSILIKYLFHSSVMFYSLHNK